MIHDLLPAQYPECFPPSFKSQFADWLALIAGQVDTAIAISRDVAEAFAQWATVEGRDINPARRLPWNHLGADFDARGLTPGRGTRKFVGASAAPYFLSVSTVGRRIHRHCRLEATVDRLDENHRLAGAAFVADRVWHDHGWYVHPHFMAFFKADLGGLIVLRKLRGDAEDTGEESTIRVLAAGKQIVRHPIEYYAPLGVGRQDIPTISAGVVHAGYSSRLALQEPEVERESAGAISMVSYGAPLQEKIRAQFGLSY